MRGIVSTIVAAALFLPGCTITDTPAPPFQGPSELGLSLTATADPDILNQDGASQSVITVQTFDANGQVARNVAFRAEIVVNGVTTDFGTLSSKSVMTNNEGRATIVYTAPPMVSSVDTDTRVLIRFTPSAGNYGNTVARSVELRLVPTGVVIAGGPTPSFTITPEGPEAYTDVLFDASGTTAALGTAILSYRWDFGDGDTETKTSATVVHDFDPGSYIVTLTVTDSNGISASTSQLLTVTPGTPPEADINFSPDSPVAGQTVYFTGEASRAAPGRRIVRYSWRFGNGLTATGTAPTTVYGAAGSYTVVLTVTDDVGQRGTASTSITVN
jgi:PKD repeat protein